MPPSVIIALAIFGACIVFAIWFEQERRKVAVDEATLGTSQKHSIGRYRASIISLPDNPKPVQLIILCDTVTGRCWTCEMDSDEWRDHRNPNTSASESTAVAVPPPHSASHGQIIGSAVTPTAASPSR
jgi:hypothetical protein